MRVAAAFDLEQQLRNFNGGALIRSSQHQFIGANILNRVFGDRHELNDLSGNRLQLLHADTRRLLLFAGRATRPRSEFPSDPFHPTGVAVRRDRRLGIPSAIQDFPGHDARQPKRVIWFLVQTSVLKALISLTPNISRLSNRYRVRFNMSDEKPNDLKEKWEACCGPPDAERSGGAQTSRQIRARRRCGG